MQERDFLGTGWAFPLQIGHTKGLAFARGEQKIKESIMLILSTAKGERMMRPNFGCDLQRLAFEPNNTVTANLAAHYVEQALTLYEPRIQVDNVTIRNENKLGRLLIEMSYRIRATNSPQNLVYPFYLRE